MKVGGFDGWRRQTPFGARWGDRVFAAGDSGATPWRDNGEGGEFALRFPPQAEQALKVLHLHQIQQVRAHPKKQAAAIFQAKNRTAERVVHVACVTVKKCLPPLLQITWKGFICEIKYICDACQKAEAFVKISSNDGIWHHCVEDFGDKLQVIQHTLFAWWALGYAGRRIKQKGLDDSVCTLIYCGNHAVCDGGRNQGQ